jgi:AraC-like DNA-binding protein
MSWAEAIPHVGLAQSLFAAGALATRKQVGLSHRLLIAMMLVLALKFLFLILYSQHAEYFDVQFSLGLVPLTFGPFLYLYSCYLTDGSPRFKLRDMLHFIPFVLVTGAYLMFFQDVVDFSDEHYLMADRHLWVRISFALLFFLSVTVYTVLTFVRLAVYRRGLEAQFSYVDLRHKLFWLNFMAILYSISGVMVMLAGAYNAMRYARVVDTTFISNLGLTLIAYGISYFGLRQPSLFRTDLVEAAPAPADDTAEGRQQKQRFSEVQAAELIAKLDRIMREERPYMNPELTLADLAAQMNLARYEVTDLLNVHIGKNFFTYVNEFRMEAVMRRLAMPDYDHLTIIAIANDCGFNSKSTFNSLFKAHTGLTPSDYKKQIRVKAQE